MLSAKTAPALERRAHDLAQFLERTPDVDFADVAYSLSARRTAYAHRRIVVSRSRDEAIAQLRSAGDPSTQGKLERRGAGVAFMFPGQGAQYVGMGRALYDVEPVFKQSFDRCAEILRPELGRDLRDVIFPSASEAEAAEASLRQTMFTQPALFTIEYALATLWQSWGIEPVALVGHSVGEFVAACLAGVFALEDAVTLVGQRGRLMQSMPPGSMLSVRAPADVVEKRLPPDIALAASNGPSLSVVAGPKEAIERFQPELERDGLIAKLLFTSHAFHSAMMEPVVEPFTTLVKRAHPVAPKIPIVSTATGTWLTAEQATDPAYWGRHLRQPVRFVEALRTLWTDPARVLLEVGPRTTCATLARQIITDRTKQTAVASMEDRTDAEWPALLRAVGQLWLGGAPVDWEAFHSIGRRRLVSLPAYPFARDRHWLEPDATAEAAPRAAAALERAVAPAVRGVLLADPSVQLPSYALEGAPDGGLVASVLAAQLAVMAAQLEALSRAEGVSFDVEAPATPPGE